jgi:preprotein translocase subunit YajC
MKPDFFQYIAQQSATPAAPQAETSSSSAGGPASILPMIVMFAVVLVFMYFFSIRPQNKEQKRKTEMLNTMSKGDTVVTSSGIIGTIATIKDESVFLKVGDGARIEFVKSAVTEIRKKGDGKSDSADSDEKASASKSKKST